VVAWPTTGQVCSSYSSWEGGHPHTVTHCSGGHSTVVTFALIGLLVFLAVAPTFTTVRLLRRLPSTTAAN
jgi:hypothetical protein